MNNNNTTTKKNTTTTTKLVTYIKRNHPDQLVDFCDSVADYLCNCVCESSSGVAVVESDYRGKWLAIPNNPDEVQFCVYEPALAKIGLAATNDGKIEYDRATGYHDYESEDMNERYVTANVLRLSVTDPAKFESWAKKEKLA